MLTHSIEAHSIKMKSQYPCIAYCFSGGATISSLCFNTDIGELECVTISVDDKITLPAMGDVYSHLQHSHLWSTDLKPVRQEEASQ